MAAAAVFVVGVGFIIYRVATHKNPRDVARKKLQEQILATEQARVVRARDKYAGDPLLDRIVQGEYWQGQTRQQLFDAKGKPEDVDEMQLKTKRKEIWKYGYRGGNSFALRITLENDVVVGWDKK